MRRRVWCETLAYADLPAVVPLLARYGVDLLLAVRPWQLAEVGDVVRRCRDAGVFVGVWPMLADEDGRWASAASCRAFVALADRLVEHAPDADELVIDLEPPFAALARIKELKPAWLAGNAYTAARAAYREASLRWRADRRVTTAVLPLLALELRGQWIQRAIGTPASALAVDRHSVMAYSTLFEGWSRGLVTRGRAERMVAGCAKLARIRFGERGAISLGTVGPGAFGDEPGYRDPGELARDVAACTAAGVDEISLFDLGGVVRRPPVETWLDALVMY